MISLEKYLKILRSPLPPFLKIRMKFLKWRTRVAIGDLQKMIENLAGNYIIGNAQRSDASKVSIRTRRLSVVVTTAHSNRLGGVHCLQCENITKCTIANC